MSRSRSVSEEEFSGWLQEPVTQRLMDYLQQQQQLLMVRWATGAFTAQDQFGTVISNSESIGMCQAFRAIEKIEFSSLQEIEHEE